MIAKSGMDLMTPQEVAETYKVSVSLLWKWRKSRPMVGPEFYQLTSRKVAYSRADVEKYFEQNKVKGGSK